MAKASPDCVGESHGGLASDGSDISGFSHMVRSPLATREHNLVTNMGKLILSTIQELVE